MYQVDRGLYVYDLEKQETKRLFTYDQDWNDYNYMILDGHVIAVCGTEDVCRVWAISIEDGAVTEQDILGRDRMVYTIEYECNKYFVGLLVDSSGNADEYYISKEDYYRSNYDGAFR